MANNFLYGVRMLIPGYELNPVKVGFTTNAQTRALSYCSGPFPVEWLGEWPAKNGKADEAAIHDAFAEDRLTGEWFNPNPNLLALIEGNVQAYRQLLKEAEAGTYGQKAKRARTGRSKKMWNDMALQDAYSEFKARAALAKIHDIPCAKCRNERLMELNYVPASVAAQFIEKVRQFQVGRPSIAIPEAALAQALEVPLECVKKWRLTSGLRRSALHKEPVFFVQHVLEFFNRSLT